MKRYGIIAIIVFLLIFIAFAIIFSDNNKENDSVKIIPHYYKDGIEITNNYNEKIIKQSIVTPPGLEFDKIKFEIRVTNTGNAPILDLKVESASPTPFKNSLPTTSQNINIGETKTIFSNLIDVANFESYQQPVKFSINISGKDEFGLLVSKENFINLKIEKKQEYIGWCYQESTNSKSIIDNDCSQNYNGYYMPDRYIMGLEHITDGLWNGDSVSKVIVNITYIKPTNAKSTSLWKVLDLNNYNINTGFVPYNLTINSRCWNYNNTFLYLRYRSEDSGSYWECYDGTQWITLRNVLSFRASEEAMIWDIKQPQVYHLF